MRSARNLLCLAALAIIPIATGCSDKDRPDEYDYDRALGIDTVLCGDTLCLHDSLQVAYTFPAGCNGMRSLTFDLNLDTVSVELIWNYYYHGVPCAHGSGVDTTILPVIFPAERAYLITYRKPDSQIVGLRIDAKP